VRVGAGAVQARPAGGPDGGARDRRDVQGDPRLQEAAPARQGRPRGRPVREAARVRAGTSPGHLRPGAHRPHRRGGEARRLRLPPSDPGDRLQSGVPGPVKEGEMSARSISRRRMLRASGVALGLPFLDAMTPAFARAAAPPRRMVAVNFGLGLHLPHLVPATTGRGYALTPYLEELKDFREQLTVISGTSLPGVDGGHLSEKSFLTTAPHPGSASFRNSISLDQLAAEKIGLETRFGFLALSHAGRGLAWTRSGAEIPTDTRPSQLYAKLFLEGKADEKARRRQQLKDAKSVLDAISPQANDLKRDLGAVDREKVDDYLAAIRETEQRLLRAEAWEGKPKPKVEMPAP